MASVILDTGALIAIERGDRGVGVLLDAASRQLAEVVTSTACVAEVWRDPARQVRLTRALRGITERTLDPDAARRCGRLLALAGTRQVVDGAVALLAGDDDVVLTSDPDDLRLLLSHVPSLARVRAV